MAQKSYVFSIKDNSVTNLSNSTDFHAIPVFKRMFFDSLIKFVEKSEFNFCALLGPRQIGKTIALKQVFAEICSLYRVQLYNFKDIVDSLEDTEDVCCDILKSIEENKLDVLLIDELTYVSNYSSFLLHLNETVDLTESKIKIIITGASCSMIARSCRRVIANNIIYLNVSFLTFYEYLVKNKKISNYRASNFSIDDIRGLTTQNEFLNITIDDFMDYVKNAYRFTHFVSIQDYLQHCVDENIVSKTNSLWTSPDNVKARVDIEVSISLILYFICST